MVIVEDIFVRFRTNLKEFRQGLLLPQPILKQLQNEYGNLNQKMLRNVKATRKLGIQTRALTTGFRGFKMELLSVMFGAQMVAGAMWGLLKPALQAAGIFDIFSSILLVTFLPIALFLLEKVILPLMNAFMNLSPSIQMIIGAFVLVAGVIATVISVGAALLLFFGGLMLLFSSAVGPGLIAGLAVGFGWIVVAILAVIAVITLLYLAWKNNFLGIGDLFNSVWERIVSIFTGAWNIIKGIWDIMAGIFTGDWKRVWEGVKNVVLGIWQMIVEGALKLSISILKFLLLLPYKVTLMMGKFAIAMLKGLIWIWTNRSEWIPKVLDALKAAGVRMLEWAKNIGSDIWSSITSFFGGGEDGFSNRIKVALGLGGIPRQTGGYVPHTGLYKLHAGETVSQANSNTFNNNISVNASSNVDIEMLKRQLSTEWSEDLSRLSRR